LQKPTLAELQCTAGAFFAVAGKVGHMMFRWVGFAATGSGKMLCVGVLDAVRRR
jgi:hypothetical protein